MRTLLLAALLLSSLVAFGGAAEAPAVVACDPWPQGAGYGCVGFDDFGMALGCWGHFTPLLFGLGAGAAVCV